MTAAIEVNLLELSPAIFNLALPGSTTEDFPAVAPTHVEIKRALQLLAADYQDSIALIGEVSGSGVNFIGILYNVLADGNFEISTEDNNESAVKLKMTAHFDPANPTVEPWAIRFPKDVLTTEA